MTKQQKKLLPKGEINLGSIYGREEMNVVNKILKESLNSEVGFIADEEESKFEKDFCSLCGTKYAIALNGAGTAIDLVIKSLDIKKGDEIISCAINFPGTHLAIIGSGAKLILSEPNIKTINIDPYDVAKRISKRTKAIVITHMNGLSAETDIVNKIIKESKYFRNRNKQPKIICDAARACGTTYKGRHVGKEAWATIFSFQSYKTITTLGEGGMVVTNDTVLANKLRDYKSFGRGGNWGSNYMMTKLQAAVGRVQVKKLHQLVEARRKLADERHFMLLDYPQIIIQKDSPNSLNSYYLYTMILPENKDGIKRDKVMKIMKEDFGVGSVVANPPTYKSNKYIKIKTKGQRLPVSDSLGNRILCLCIHPLMTEQTNNYVMESFIKSFKSEF